jgi:hypothetical protein
MRESRFQRNLILELEEMFPGCIIMKNDCNYIQGIPDLTILFGKHWAVLECKRSMEEDYEPNQEYYLDRLDNMSFAAMICPENKEAVLYELQQSFSTRRTARFSKC